MKETSAGFSRRRFLGSALAAAAASGLAPEPARGGKTDPEREKLERLVAEYGSELGALRRAGTGGR